MTYKSVLVHVGPSEDSHRRLRTAVDMARMFGARLIGVAARTVEGRPDPIGLSLTKLKEMVEAEHARARQNFLEIARDVPGGAVWREEFEFPTEALLRHACGADLIVADRNVEGQPRETQVGAADLIMGAGVPVLTVPEDARGALKNVLIGWKNTRETRRVLRDALPLLLKAEKVSLLRFSGAPAPEMTEVVERLALHGVRAEPDVRTRAAESVAEDLLLAARDMDAGLIIAGGYGHSRFREWALGGVTQGLLTKADRRILFSH